MREYGKREREVPQEGALGTLGLLHLLYGADVLPAAGLLDLQIRLNEQVAGRSAAERGKPWLRRARKHLN